MSKEVWEEAYEIVGDGLPIAVAFYEARKSALNAQFAYAKSIGGEGFRPDINGSMRSVLFKELPAKWRKIGGENKLIEATPYLNNSEGKAIAAAMKALPRITPERCVPTEFGCDNISPMDGRKLYFPVMINLSLPAPRYFVQVPRQVDDGFTAPAMLREIRMSELMQAIEDHNAAARQYGQGE